MKNFHISICLSISFLALVPSTANGKAVASLSNLPNIIPHETSSTVKLAVFRHKRETVDYCENFLPKSRKKVTSCVPLEDINPACTEAECPNKPSYPSGISHVFYLNKTTKKLHLNISWGKPLFGINNLCGFQVNVASLRHPFGTICAQLNSKDMYSYSIPNVAFNGKYNITITSLPAVKEDMDKSCSFITVKSEDKCTVLRKVNESLPWKCNIRKNFPVVCKNGSINVTLEGLHNTVVDFYTSEIIRRGTKPLVLRTKHVRDQPYAAYSNLTLGAEYDLYIYMYKEGQWQTTKSEPFICKETIPTGGPPTTGPTPNPTEDSPIVIIVSVFASCIILLAFVIISVRCKLAAKSKNLLGSGNQPIRPFLSDNSLQQDIPNEYQPRVVFVYPIGCEYLEELVVLIGQLLKSMGCNCVLDLYMESDRNIFMMEKIEELQRDDRVIFFNYKGTNCDSQNALRCHKNLIYRKRFWHLLRRDNFIVIQFDAQETISLATNICFASNARKGLQRFIRIIWRIPKFQFREKYPQQNAVQIDPDVENAILLKLASVNASFHGNCQVESCCKGKRPTCSSFSIGNATSTNSFGSLFTSYDDVNYGQHIRAKFSRLSSSEPLLINT